jgi:hypothetical protein
MGGLFYSPRRRTMWVNVLSGAIMMTMEVWMQIGQWLWF